MYKHTTYKEKFATLKEWTPEIIEVVKKDLKNDHLKQDYVFARKYLAGKNLNKVTLEDLIDGYSRAIEQEETGEKIAEFICNRWMIHSSELYGFFEKELEKINPDFDTIEELEDALAGPLIERATQEFGALNTYLFSVINSVAFKKEQFEALLSQAKALRSQHKAEQEKIQELKSFEELKRNFEQKLVRLEDKYVKKLEGLERKYLKDTEMLKKQVGNLQRKLNV